MRLYRWLKGLVCRLKGHVPQDIGNALGKVIICRRCGELLRTTLTGAQVYINQLYSDLIDRIVI